MTNLSSDNHSDSQSVLNQIVLEFLREQKRKRRGRWLLRGIIIFLIIGWFYSASGFMAEDSALKSKPHAGLIDINGTILATETANADDFLKGMESAYKSKGLKAMIFRINSPGGSPVQADYIYDIIRDYSKRYPKIKTYAVCVDICASGGYYIAAAANKIYANPSRMVGSIGVLYNGFGFTDTLQKVGVSRRLQTAGANKGFLDPFSPEKPEEKAFLQTLLNDVHSQFINRVKEGRGARLKVDNLTFSGLFWTGQQAKDRGLIDGFASAGDLAKNTIKVRRVIDYTHAESMFEKVTKTMGTLAYNPLGALGLAQSGIKISSFAEISR